MSEFSFVVMSDSHLLAHKDVDVGFWWNRMLLSCAPEILGEAVRQTNARRPDFVVHCGDLTQDGSRESFAAARRILDGLDAPVYFAPGNHDVAQPLSRRVAAGAFKLDEDRLYDVVRVSGWRIILLDCMYWLRKDGSFPNHRAPGETVGMRTPDFEMDWLQAELRRDNRTPTLCFMHPFLAMRESYPVGRMPGGCSVDEAQSFAKETLDGTKELKALLAQHHCVKAAFSGHGHWHDWLVEDGMIFCQTAALVAYPCEMRLVQVSNDRIETEVFGLPGTDYAEQSLVDEWGNRWVAGRDIDRAAKHDL